MRDRRLQANKMHVIYTDRLAGYRNVAYERDSYLAQEIADEVIPKTVDMRYLSHPTIAARMGDNLRKHETYDDKIFQAHLMPKFLYLDVGAVLTLNMVTQKLSSVDVRVMHIAKPSLVPGRASGPVVTCRIENSYLNSFDEHTVPATTAVSIEPSPATSVVPLAFELPSVLSEGVIKIAIAAVRFDSSVDGVDIYISENDDEYIHRQGWTINDFPPTGDVKETVEAGENRIIVNSDAYVDAFASFTRLEQRNNRSVALLGELQTDQIDLATGWEIINYREAEADGSNTALRNCARGLWYTLKPDAAHGTDAKVIMLGTTNFVVIDDIPASKIGKTMKIKCVAFNSDGDEQDFDDVDINTYVIRGYALKATHTSNLEHRVGGVGQGGLIVVETNAVTFQWKRTNKDSGIGTQAIGEWIPGAFEEDATITYQLLAYDNTFALQATHDLTDAGIGLPTWDSANEVWHFEYTEAQNTTDFGGLTKDIYVGIRPKNTHGVGYVPWVRKKHTIINT